MREDIKKTKPVIHLEKKAIKQIKDKFEKILNNIHLEL